MVGARSANADVGSSPSRSSVAVPFHPPGQTALLSLVTPVRVKPKLDGHLPSLSFRVDTRVRTFLLVARLLSEFVAHGRVMPGHFFKSPEAIGYGRLRQGVFVISTEDSRLALSCILF